MAKKWSTNATAIAMSSTITIVHSLSRVAITSADRPPTIVLWKSLSYPDIRSSSPASFILSSSLVQAVLIPYSKASWRLRLNDRRRDNYNGEKRNFYWFILKSRLNPKNYFLNGFSPICYEFLIMFIRFRSAWQSCVMKIWIGDRINIEWWRQGVRSNLILRRSSC